MEKLILVYYIYVGNLNPSEVGEYISELNSSLFSIEKEHGILSFIVPCTTGETRIECINPVVISEDEYKKTKKTLQSCKNKIDEFIKSHESIKEQ